MVCDKENKYSVFCFLNKFDFYYDLELKLFFKCGDIHFLHKFASTLITNGGKLHLQLFISMSESLRKYFMSPSSVLILG